LAHCGVIVALVAETIANRNCSNSGPVTMAEINHSLGRGNQRQLSTNDLLQMRWGMWLLLKANLGRMTNFSKGSTITSRNDAKLWI